MYYEWAIVLFTIWHVQTGMLPKTYPDAVKCETARQRLGYASVSPFGVHGECQQVAVPAPLVPPK